MANQIQRLVEDSIEEVEDLLDRGLFNKEEVGALVAKRREFETRIHRFEVVVSDFLQYIEYELSVSKLIQKRKARLQVKRSGIADYVSQRRINFIFDNALRKFKGNLDLWVAAIEYAQECNNDGRLSKLLGSAIKLFPTNIDFWTLAASHEFEKLKNIDAARALMLQALRVNGHSATLWTEYFKLEMLFMNQVIERNETLGTEIDVDVFAKVPQVISNKALDACPDENARMIVDFFKISEAFVSGGANDVAMKVVDHLLDKADNVLAESIDDELLVEMVKRKIKGAKDEDKVLRQECEKYNHTALWDFYIERVASRDDKSLVSEICQKAFDEHVLSESSALLWLEAITSSSSSGVKRTRRGNVSEVNRQELASMLTARFPQSSTIWKVRCDEEPEALKQAVEALNPDDALPFWEQLSAQDPNALYKALHALVKDPSNGPAVKEIVDRILAKAPSTVDEIKKLERQCLNVLPQDCFATLCSNEELPDAQRKEYFELWTRRYPQSSTAWKSYVEFAKRFDGGKPYRNVLLRALHNVPSLKISNS